jgi:hypothetical protein
MKFNAGLLKAAAGWALELLTLLGVLGSLSDDGSSD